MEESEKSPNARPKHHIPKILILDCGWELEEPLRVAGYNLSTGTFGHRYCKEKSDAWHPLVTNESIPDHYAESDIVIVDLDAGDVLAPPGQERTTIGGTEDCFFKPTTGIVDPRPFIMYCFQQELQQIVMHGGILIVFASPLQEEKYTIGSAYYSGRRSTNEFLKSRDLKLSNWSFLPDAWQPYACRASGREIALDGSVEAAFKKVLEAHLASATYTCTLRQPTTYRHVLKNWHILAQNRFKETVASLVVPSQEVKGIILRALY